MMIHLGGTKMTYCTHCGNPLKEGVKFCTSCGYAVRRVEGEQNATKIAQPQFAQSVASNVKQTKHHVLRHGANDQIATNNSYFDGGMLSLIWNRLVALLITIFTLGIGFPWAVCLVCEWETKHTVINGHRLGFDGKAMQFFGNWIKWQILTIITLGIYGFWLGIKVKQWITKHTYMID